jgi:hypothetical protein
MVKKIIILMGLLFPTIAMAERPAMEERFDAAADEDPMLRFEPVQEAEPTTEPVVTEQVSGDVLELRPGDSIFINPLDFPVRGMTMDKVQNELGRPVEIAPSIGEPPITRWTYADRVVFFEHSKVIHVVERR